MSLSFLSELPSLRLVLGTSDVFSLLLAVHFVKQSVIASYRSLKSINIYWISTMYITLVNLLKL